MLDAAVGVFNGFVVFQPIINGIGGNLVSVQASKISTMLHQSSILGIVPPHAKVCESPWRALVKGGSSQLGMTGTSQLTIFSAISSSVCEDCSYSHPDVDSWSNHLHLPGWLHPHVDVDDWIRVHLLLLVSEPAAGEVHQSLSEKSFLTDSRRFRFVFCCMSRTCWSTWCGSSKSTRTTLPFRTWRRWAIF